MEKDYLSECFQPISLDKQTQPVKWTREQSVTGIICHHSYASAKSHYTRNNDGVHRMFFFSKDDILQRV